MSSLTKRRRSCATSGGTWSAAFGVSNTKWNDTLEREIGFLIGTFLVGLLVARPWKSSSGCVNGGRSFLTIRHRTALRSRAAIRLVELGISLCTPPSWRRVRPLQSDVGGDTCSATCCSKLKTFTAPAKSSTVTACGGLAYTSEQLTAKFATKKAFRGSSRLSGRPPLQRGLMIKFSGSAASDIGLQRPSNLFRDAQGQNGNSAVPSA